MNRYVEQDVSLSDGTVLPRGSRVSVASSYLDPAVYPDPGQFDAARFLRKRAEPGQEHGWQFVTTTPAYLFIGHGQHACPGRFFAAHELKIAMAHLLLKYDWRLPDGYAPVMMQQTITLRASDGAICAADPWPYPPGVDPGPDPTGEAAPAVG